MIDGFPGPVKMDRKISSRPVFVPILFIMLLILCVSPLVSAPMALLLGIIFSLTLGNPFLSLTQAVTKQLLQFSVIGLGAGMNLAVIGHQSIYGIFYTVIGIVTTMLLGLALGKCLKIEANISLLLTVGTAICGGSAIAAVAPVIRAKPQEISVALATVFFLNASALFIFSPIGHYFDLNQIQFGFWSALAIHDTSSVIGSAMQYGSQATELATMVKLARALWIIPVALVISFIWSRKSDSEIRGKTKFPWFILGFILAAALVSCFPGLQPAGLFFSAIAKKILVLTLFLIGSTFVRSTVINVGFRPFLQGLVLWFIMASGTLIAILSGLIK